MAEPVWDEAKARLVKRKRKRKPYVLTPEQRKARSERAIKWNKEHPERRAEIQAKCNAKNGAEAAARYRARKKQNDPT